LRDVYVHAHTHTHAHTSAAEYERVVGGRSTRPATWCAGLWCCLSHTQRVFRKVRPPPHPLPPHRHPPHRHPWRR
jgi:hypothetical protein